MYCVIVILLRRGIKHLRYATGLVDVNVYYGELWWVLLKANRYWSTLYGIRTVDSRKFSADNPQPIFKAYNSLCFKNLNNFVNHEKI